MGLSERPTWPACFEAHAKDKQKCSFLYTRWTVIKFWPEHWLDICLAHSRETDIKAFNKFSSTIQKTYTGISLRSQSCPRAWECCSEIKAYDWDVLTTRWPVIACRVCGLPKLDKDLKGIGTDTTIPPHSHSGSHSIYLILDRILSWSPCLPFW